MPIQRYVVRLYHAICRVFVTDEGAAIFFLQYKPPPLS